MADHLCVLSFKKKLPTWLTLRCRISCGKFSSGHNGSCFQCPKLKLYKDPCPDLIHAEAMGGSGKNACDWLYIYKLHVCFTALKAGCSCARCCTDKMRESHFTLKYSLKSENCLWLEMPVVISTQTKWFCHHCLSFEGISLYIEFQSHPRFSRLQG